MGLLSQMKDDAVDSHLLLLFILLLLLLLLLLLTELAIGSFFSSPTGS